jgi:HAD superfamily hydrolase (TIGR01549 family)
MSNQKLNSQEPDLQKLDLQELNPQDIKVISFDLDNTLYDNTPVISRAEKQSQEYLTLEFGKQNKIYDVNVFKEIRKKLFESNHIAFDNLTHLRQECLRELCIGLENRDLIIQKATDIFIDLRQQASIPEEIVSMIKSLSKNYILVSITNGNCDANNLTIGKYFKKNYSPQQGHRAKPHTEMFEKVIDDFQIDANQLLHVGDEEKSDGLGAKNAGCHFYLIKPFEKLKDLQESISPFLTSLDL